jgi:hypothetical protein
VAHDEDGAAVVDEVALEPGDGVEVEVVGGLVEEQEIGLLSEDDAELQPPALATRERRDGAREVLVGEAELAREDGDLALELVAAARW